MVREALLQAGIQRYLLWQADIGSFHQLERPVERFVAECGLSRLLLEQLLGRES